MTFNSIDSKMRVYESLNDERILPNMYVVVRLDGRSFTRLTKEVHNFEAPFDEWFRDLMVDTTKHLMQCGFRVVYGYTESDEISLLLKQDDNTFDRKVRKILSVLAGEASAKFSLLLGDLGCFDARVSQLPTKDLVVDYFRWRSEDAHRNSLGGYCYWTLRKSGVSARKATSILSGMTTKDKNELLFQHGINFNDLPIWQKRGIGLYWEEYEKPSFNPKTQEEAVAIRSRIKVDYEIPMKEEYSEFIRSFL